MSTLFDEWGHELMDLFYTFDQNGVNIGWKDKKKKKLRHLDAWKKLCSTLIDDSNSTKIIWEY